MDQNYFYISTALSRFNFYKPQNGTALFKNNKFNFNKSKLSPQQVILVEMPSQDSKIYLNFTKALKKLVKKHNPYIIFQTFTGEALITKDLTFSSLASLLKNFLLKEKTWFYGGILSGTLSFREKNFPTFARIFFNYASKKNVENFELHHLKLLFSEILYRNDSNKNLFNSAQVYAPKDFFERIYKITQQSITDLITEDIGNETTC